MLICHVSPTLLCNMHTFAPRSHGPGGPSQGKQRFLLHCFGWVGRVMMMMMMMMMMMLI